MDYSDRLGAAQNDDLRRAIADILAANDGRCLDVAEDRAAVGEALYHGLVKRLRRRCKQKRSTFCLRR